MKMKKQKNHQTSSLPTFNGTIDSKSPSGLLACQSPARLSVPSSPVYEHSSPIISESDSLKLILSSSPDSSCSLSPSSHQESSSKSKRKPAKKASSKSSKVKRVLLAEFSTSASAGPKAKPLKGRGSKSTPKQKRANGDKSVGSGAAKVKFGRKKQHTPHQDSKDKAAKAKKQKTTGKKERKKVSMKVADNSPIDHGLSSTLTSVNFPDIAADEPTEIVTGEDGCTEAVTGDAGSAARDEHRDSNEEEREDRQELQKTTTFTWYEIHVHTLISLGVTSCDMECVFDFHCLLRLCLLRLCTLVYRVLIHICICVI
jgi:hypothetical protein